MDTLIWISDHLERQIISRPVTEGIIDGISPHVVNVFCHFYCPWYSPLCRVTKVVQSNTTALSSALFIYAFLFCRLTAF